MAKFEVIKQLLDKQKISYEVIDLPDRAISVEDVIRLTGGKVKREEMIKTLIVKTKQGNFLACVLRGEDRLNINKNLNDRLMFCLQLDKLATREEVEGMAGVKIGAICPILIGIPVVIDKKVSNLKRVNMGSGDHLKGLEMDFEDLLRVLSDYTIKEISV